MLPSYFWCRSLFWAFGITTFCSCTNSSLDHDRFLKPVSDIRGIFEDSKGNLWFTSTEWVCRYDPSAREADDGGFTYFTQDEAGGILGGFQEDFEGRLLRQDANGISVFDGNKFTPINNVNFDARYQWEKRDGDLWFGVDQGVAFSEEEGQWGVYRYRDGACTFLAFPEAPPGERHRFYTLTSEAMHAKDGMLWFGTFNAAFGFDGESFDIVGRERMGRADDPQDIGIRGYHLDSQGNLWMADNGAGIYVYDGESVVHFTAMHNLRDVDTDGNSLHRAFSIAQDKDGNFWFGTVYSGIWRYQPSASDPIGKGSFTNYDDEQGFPCENTWTIYTTRSGELLFAGENPGGVYRFNGDSFERIF